MYCMIFMWFLGLSHLLSCQFTHGCSLLWICSSSSGAADAWSMEVFNQESSSPWTARCADQQRDSTGRLYWQQNELKEQ